MRRSACLYIILTIGLVALFVLDLCIGAVNLSPWQLFSSDNPIYQRLLFDYRLPKALTAVIAGVSLSLSGLIMQTLFRNPLAGPYVLGVSSGATLGVATVVLCGSLLGFAANGIQTVVAAIVGAMFVLLCVMAVSWKIENTVSLLVVGMMFGSIAGALVNLMQNFADPDSLKLFVVWTLGSLSSVGWEEMRVLFPVFVLGLLSVACLMKSLNGLLLGEQYARGLGISMKRLHGQIILSIALLSGGVTAFCGPIAFVGVAVPFMARGLFRTGNHRTTLPASALIGADLLLVCDVLSNAFTYPLPISTVSALFGAPVVVYIMLRRQS